MPTVHQRYGRTDGRTDGQTDGRTTYDSKVTITAHRIQSAYMALSEVNAMTDKKAVLSQGNRAMPQLLIFGLKFADNNTSLRVAKLRKPGFRAPNVPAQNSI